MIEHTHLPYPELIQGVIGYKNNMRLRKAGCTYAFTTEHLEEYARCSDPVTGLEYFLDRYIKVEVPDGQIIPYEPYAYQRRFARAILENRFVLALWARQSGKTTAAAAIILWHLLFKRNYTVVLAANKLIQAIEVLDRIKLAIEWVPLWMQQGVVTWRGTRIEFENGSKVDAAATSSSGVRGRSISLLYLDEFSHIHPNTQIKFYESVYPAISAGKETKLLITTTPSGLDMFYKLWTDSQKGENNFVRVESHWSEKPGRDEAWAAAERARLGDDGFAQEYDTAFLGSSATLINGRIIATIPTMKPERVTTLGVKVFHPPEKDHVYVAVADVSRGLGLDYQAMVLIDVAVKPWRVAATYRNNLLPPSMFHEVIHDTVRYYNDAMILVETNDVGLRVAEDLLQIDEYENVVMTQVKGKYGTRVGGGFGQNSRYGVKTNPQVKKIGCAQLKQLVEKWQLVINDSDILWEMGRFVGKNNTYKAEDGAHDDLMMCLVLFGWLTEQKQFKENVEGSDLRAAMIAHAAEQERWNEEDLTPFGVHDDGRGDETGELRDVQSMSWDGDVKW